MAKNDYGVYKRIFLENNGILRASKAIKLGIPEFIIYQMLKNGELIRESRGLYRLTDVVAMGNPDLIQVSYLIPNAVICLISALYFYGLTTQIPYQVYIALDRDSKKPRIPFPPLKVFYLSRKIFTVGIEEQVIDGIKVKIYSRERTIADCFKFRNTIGTNIAIEALKDYIQQPGRKINELMTYAKAVRVEKIISPYLESLL